MASTQTKVGPQWQRATRPLLWWFVASLLLLLWRFHYTHAARATVQFTVSLESKAGLLSAETTLNGRPYRAGEPSGVGWRKLRVRAPGFEPVETERFVWYGGVALGDLTLARSRGRLELDLTPAAESVRILGEEEDKTLDHATHGSFLLPTGRYAVMAKFARFSEERTVEIDRDQTNRVVLTPKLTTLVLNSAPDGTEFELTSVKPPEVRVSGRTPATVADLPSGEYALSMWRGRYRKQLSIPLSGPTNRHDVEFRYAKVAVSSEPPDAAISDGERVVGRTPANLELVPGTYRLQIDKDGYLGTNVSLTLAETDTRAVAVTLVNGTFLEALERARNAFSGFSADYDRALADVDQALRIKPADETALGLKRNIEFNRYMRSARRLQSAGDFANALSAADAALKLGVNDADVAALNDELLKGQRDAAVAQAEVRRNRPLKKLPELTRKLAYDELFDRKRHAEHLRGA